MKCTVTAFLVLAGVLSARAADPSNSITVPIQLRRGHVIVPVKVGGTNLSFLLDTGYGVTMLRADHAASLGLQRRGSMTIVGIAGEVPADVFEGPSFEIGGKSWKPRRVAALATAEGRSRRRDGILGSGLFRSFVVEIDPKAKTLTLHDPAQFKYSGNGEVLPLRFAGSTPIVSTAVVLTNGSEVKADFEIDTGCTGGLCIGKHFVEAHDLAPGGRESERRGVGGGARTRSGHLPALRLGKISVDKPSADFFLEGSPADPPLAGHIGAEVLNNFRVIFDYSRKQMILEKL
jgi:predicted aspartyl protease